MIDEFVLRQFDPADTTGLRELFAQSIEYLTHEDYDEAQRLAWISQAEDWEEFDERLKSGDTFVVEVDAELAGFTLFKNADEIDMLFVHPYHTRKGVARRLLEAVVKLAEARGCKKLTVDASDTARPFFEAQGFEASERHLISLEDQWLSNTTMIKSLVSDQDATGRAPGGQDM